MKAKINGKTFISALDCLNRLNKIGVSFTIFSFNKRLN